MISNESHSPRRQATFLTPPPEKRVRVEEKSQRSFPTFEFVTRQWFKERGRDFQLPPQRTWLAISLFPGYRNESHERLGTACDDNVLSTAGLLHQSREMGFRLVNRNCRHISYIS